MNLNGARAESSRPVNPVQQASFLSKHSFWWLRHVFRQGLKRPIDEQDIFECLPSHGSKKLSTTFGDMWTEEKQSESPSLFRVMRRIYAKKIVVLGFIFTLIDTLTKLVQPQCLGGLVTYFSPGNHNLTIDDAYLYAGGIVGCSFVAVICFHAFIFYTLQLGMRVRLTCCSLIYKKVLKISKSVSVDGLNGQVINLMSNDVARFDQSIAFLHDLWKGPVELMLMGYFIYREIGYYGLFGIGFLLCFLPIQTWIGRRAAVYRFRTAKRTDCRVRIMNEIIQAIQVIKMYTWEKSFAKVVDAIRKKELRGIRGTLFIRATLLSFNIISRFSIFVSLATYVYFGNVFTARKVFIVTSYFNFLYSSLLHFWPLGISAVSETRISINRIQDFLMLPENKRQVEILRAKLVGKARVSLGDNVELEQLLAIGEKAPLEILPMLISSESLTKKDDGNKRRFVNESAPRKGVVFKNATAGWLREESGSNVGILNVDLDVAVGRLCSVIGIVGSGKSTILQVILGELELDSGSVAVNGTLSYASQEPWLFEGTIRQNILFIEPYDEKRYNEVVRVCALERDFDLFPYGDATIVGERGTSLSGGQRARVNLARAIYKQADIYLLDDPLSAVDTHVGKHIFEKCIKEFLKKKACILITHQLQYLKDVEHTVLMNAGRVEAQGSYELLKNSKNHSLLWRGVDEDSTENDEERNETEVVAKSVKILPTIDQDDNREAQIVGSVGFRVYKSYFASVNNVCFVMVVLMLFCISQGAISAVDLFVSKWVSWEDSIKLMKESREQGRPFNDTVLSRDEVMGIRYQYIHTYAIAMLVVLYLVFQRSYAFFQMCLVASRRIHDHLFRGITRGWMSFFNTNPSGRILNRFSKDIGNIDTILPVALMDCLLFACELLAIIILVSVANYWLLLPTIVMSIIFYGLRFVYVNSARCIKRVEALTRSPLFSHTNATLQGISTIRAFKAENILANEFDVHQDLNTSSWYLFLATTRAFALWLELTCVLYMGTVLLSFLLLGNNTHGGMLGLAITQIFNLITMCQWGMRQTAELENQMTSVERVNEYTNIDSEPSLESTPANRPSDMWPQSGVLRFNSLTMRYTPTSAPVLRDLSFSIRAKEKIGIVGRTGAGKSSIIQALFRLAHNQGQILIDDVDTASLGLHDLRSKISIIPQDPILFSGNMRNNLDPFEEKTDDEIWSALNLVELRTVIQKLPGGLECRMSDGGSNFSMGQRQLVCLARAILRNNKILILDEATANVDAETDNLIQTTIRKQFADCTVLTIAHRLHTVMDSDRVLVMDAGRMVELGHPHELLGTVDGFLRGLVDQTGSVTANHLMQIAELNFRATNQ